MAKWDHDDLRDKTPGRQNVSVIGNKCGFCLFTVETPCTNSDDASRCRRTGDAAVNLLRKEPATTTPAVKPFTENDAVELLRKASAPAEPLDVQIGGDHYKRMAIQPITYIEANELGFSEGNVVKYVTRWKFKGGIQDLEKALDVLTKKIAFEKEKVSNASRK